MSIHTPATDRIIAVLSAAGRQLVELGPDMIAVHASVVPLVRSDLLAHPHFVKYIDRVVRVKKIMVGDTEQFIWRFGRQDDDITANCLALSWVKTERIVHRSPDPVDYVASSLSSGAIKYLSTSTEGGVTTTSLGDAANTYELTVKKFGATKFGNKVPLGGVVISIPADYDYSPGGPKGTFHESGYQAGSTVDYLPLTSVTEEDYQLVVGPVAIERGEIYPDFSWFESSGVDISSRMRTVANYVKTQGATIPDNFISYLDQLEQENTRVLSFRCTGLAMEDMWPALEALNGGYASLPTDADFTQEVKNTVRERWSAGKWFVSAVLSESGSDLLFDSTIEKQGGVKIRFRGTEVHFISTAGTISRPAAEAPGLVDSLQDSGITVTDDTSSLSVPAVGTPTRNDYEALMAAIASPASAGSTGSPDGVRNGVIAGIMNKPIVETDETRPLLSLVTPQTFWANA